MDDIAKQRLNGLPAEELIATFTEMNEELGIPMAPQLVAELALAALNGLPAEELIAALTVAKYPVFIVKLTDGRFQAATSSGTHGHGSTIVEAVRGLAVAVINDEVRRSPPRHGHPVLGTR